MDEEKKHWRKCHWCKYQNYVYLSKDSFRCERCGKQTIIKKEGKNENKKRKR